MVTVNDLIQKLQLIENKNNLIDLIGNETKGEDEDFDINFNDLEIWDNSDDTVTLFLNNK
tara:strand:+ start:320 stop:499 length:180 start_codon:yes stop_codon:yes gene_type:complete